MSASETRFPANFLWGAATAAHQVEGNNLNSDLWVLEHVQGSMFREPSGDACDHYHRYPEDLKTLAALDFNCYRFSIEWARIEPERGQFSTAELDHYRRMLAACHENRLAPMVTFYHFTSPRWFAAAGGWEAPDAAELFTRYAERASKDTTTHYPSSALPRTRHHHPSASPIRRALSGGVAPSPHAFRIAVRSHSTRRQ